MVHPYALSRTSGIERLCFDFTTVYIFLSSKLLRFFFLVLDRLFICRELCVHFLVLVTLDVRRRGFFYRNK